MVAWKSRPPFFVLKMASTSRSPPPDRHTNPQQTDTEQSKRLGFRRLYGFSEESSIGANQQDFGLKIGDTAPKKPAMGLSRIHEPVFVVGQKHQDDIVLLIKKTPRRG